MLFIYIFIEIQMLSTKAKIVNIYIKKIVLFRSPRKASYKEGEGSRKSTSLSNLMKPSDLLQPSTARGPLRSANPQSKRYPKPADLSDLHKQVCFMFYLLHFCKLLLLLFSISLSCHCCSFSLYCSNSLPLPPLSLYFIGH